MTDQLERLTAALGEPWHLPAWHVLGAIFLEMYRAADAERVYKRHWPRRDIWLRSSRF